MAKNDFGVWEVIIPPNPDGTCAIPHDSKIKASFVRSCVLGSTLTSDRSR
jgi:hypothetical protein